MELVELEKQLAWSNKKLFKMLQEQPDFVEKEGLTEYEYRTALASEMVKLKAADERATLIPDLAKGDKAVAKLRLEYHIASGIADANREAIRAAQSTISALMSLVAVERAKIDKGLYSEGS